MAKTELLSTTPTIVSELLPGHPEAQLLTCSHPWPWSLGVTLASSPFLTPTSNQQHILWDLPPKEIPNPMSSHLLAWVPAPIISHLGEGFGPPPSCPHATEGIPSALLPQPPINSE